METPTTPKSFQEMNEGLDRLHPEYGQYVLINEQKGLVSWHETYDSALRYQAQHGGIIFNTKTTCQALLKTSIEKALQNTHSQNPDK